MKSFSACDIIVTLIIGGFFLMAKKKDVGKYLGFGAVLFALVAVIMMFLAGIVVKTGRDSTESYSVFKIAFGGKISENTVAGVTSKSVFKFNFLTCMAAVFVIVGLVFTLLAALKIGSAKLWAFLGGALLIVGAIFMFCLIGLTSIQSTVTGGSTNLNNVTKLSEMDKDSVKLGTGAILAGVFGIIGGVASLGRAVIGK